MFRILIYCLRLALLSCLGSTLLSANDLTVVTMQQADADGCQAPQFQIFRVAWNERMQRRFVCDATSWQRAQRLVERGEIDAMITLATPARLQYAVHGAVPILRAELRLFTRSNHAFRAQMNLAKSLSDLAPFTLVTYHGDGWAKQMLPPLNIALDYADDMQQVLQKIDLGHGDATIQSGVHLSSDLRRMNLINGVVMLDPVFGHTEYYLLINRRSRFVPLLDELDRALLAMQADGTTAKLMAQFYAAKAP